MSFNILNHLSRNQKKNVVFSKGLEFRHILGEHFSRKLNTLV